MSRVDPMPCWRCGAAVAAEKWGCYDWIVLCHNLDCQAEGPVKETRAEAVAWWNTRHVPADPKAIVESGEGYRDFDLFDSTDEAGDFADEIDNSGKPARIKTVRSWTRHQA